MAILKESVLQSAHWYTRDGKACHTMPTADGKSTRPTTLADARKLGLLPSVSAILQVLDKPGLDKWKMEQVALAGMTLKRDKKETDEYYMDRVIVESRKKVKDAGDFGTGVHGEMERYWASKLPGGAEFAPNAVTFAHTSPAIQWIESKKLVPVANETIIINLEHGFGGTSDLPCLMPGRSGPYPVHVDYKTKKTEAGKALLPYLDQVMQIASYGATYWKEQFARCWGLNLYLSSTEPGRTEAAFYSPQMMAAAWDIFKMLCAVWRHDNEYDPRIPLGQTQPVFHQAKMVVIAGPGGKLLDAPVIVAEKISVAPPPPPPAPNLIPPPPPPPPGANFPATGPTALEVIEGAVLTQPECDGTKFLSPRDCTEMPAGKTDYAWWWHAETKTARVSIRNDAAMREHGWLNFFLAYPADARASGKAPGKPDVVKPGDPLPLTEGKDKQKTKHLTQPERVPTPPLPPIKKADPVAVKKRIAEIEAMPITFGKFKKHAKVKVIGDLPLNYLDYLRDVANVPDHVKEYLAFPLIEKRINKSLS